jgi:hypothetical protein
MRRLILLTCSFHGNRAQHVTLRHQTGRQPPSFRTSEPWLVQNMYYLLAANALDKSINAEPPRP